MNNSKDVYLAYGKGVLADVTTVRHPESPLPSELNGELIGGNHLTNAAHHFGTSNLKRPLNLTDVVVIHAIDEPDFHFRFYICDRLGPVNEMPQSSRLRNEDLENLLTSNQYGHSIIRDRVFVMEENLVMLFKEEFTERGYKAISFTEPEIAIKSGNSEQQKPQ